MPLKYDPPKRCLLVQAAIWFKNRTLPLPDDIFLTAPVIIEDNDDKLRDLFLALRIHDCDLKGTLSIEVGASKTEIFLKADLVVDREHLHLDQLSFSNSKLVLVDKGQFGLSCEVLGEDFEPESEALGAVGEHYRDIRKVLENQSEPLPLVCLTSITVDFEKLQIALGKTPDAETKRKESSSKNRACQDWLVEKMKAGGPKFAKVRYRKEGQEKFDVTGRGFDFIWKNAIEESDNTSWSKTGPRPNS